MSESASEPIRDVPSYDGHGEPHIGKLRKYRLLGRIEYGRCSCVASRSQSLLTWIPFG